MSPWSRAGAGDCDSVGTFFPRDAKTAEETRKKSEKDARGSHLRDAHPRRARRLAPGSRASPRGRACLPSDAMSSLADALASLESANACIDAIAGSYPRAFPNDRTSRPIDLTSETARVRREQQTLQRAMTSENDAPVSTSRREKNFYVAPGGVLVNAALVPEPDPAPKRKEPRRDPPPRASHPPNARARLGNETHSAEARAVQWLRDKVVPLLPKQHDPKAVFGRTALGLRTFPLDRDDDEAAREGRAGIRRAGIRRRLSRRRRDRRVRAARAAGGARGSQRGGPGDGRGVRALPSRALGARAVDVLARQPRGEAPRSVRGAADGRRRRRRGTPRTRRTRRAGTKTRARGARVSPMPRETRTSRGASRRKTRWRCTTS